MAVYYGFTLDVRVYPSVRQSYVRPSVRISFSYDNLSKHQWILTKFGICIGILWRSAGIANGQISSNIDGSCLPDIRPYFRFRMITSVDFNGFTCIDIVEIWFGIVNGQISSNFDGYLPETHPYFRFRTITEVNIKGF